MKTTVCRLESRSLTTKRMELAIESYVGSVEYMKHLIPLAAYNIIYHRINYDEKDYITHKMGDTSYKAVNPEVGDRHQLRKLHFLMKNAMVSLEKRYMDELFIVFRTNDTKEVFEHYRFTLKYDRRDTSVLPTGQAVVDATAKFFKSLKTLDMYKKLDGRKVNLAVQIINNECAPSTYITPYFKLGGEPYVDPEDKVENCSLGTISTGFHKLKVFGKGKVWESSDVGSEAQTRKSLWDDDVHTDVESEGNSGSKNESADKRQNSCDDENAAKKRKIEDHANDTKMHYNTVTDTFNDDEEEINVEFNCICEIPEKINSIPIIPCKLCKMHTHLSCIGYKTIDSFSFEYICFDCCKRKNKKFCDGRLKHLKTKNGRMTLAIKRLITMHSLNNPEISPRVILNKITGSGIKKQIAAALNKANLIYIVNDDFKANVLKMQSRVSDWFQKDCNSMRLEQVSAFEGSTFSSMTKSI